MPTNASASKTKGLKSGEFFITSFISQTVALVLSAAHLVLIHPKVVRYFVPNGLADDLGDRHVILGGGVLNRQLIQSNSVGHCGAHAVPIAARGRRHAV